jgi:hypothetical protein
MYIHMRPSYPINCWGVPLKALPGFFNLLAFMIDPAIYNALSAIKKYVQIDRLYDYYSTVLPIPAMNDCLHSGHSGGGGAATAFNYLY